ncbi:MAG: hypothetical protein ABFD79_08385 [Phycisphaerales bacterium]
MNTNGHEFRLTVAVSQLVSDGVLRLRINTNGGRKVEIASLRP